jgi:hypothetical protein
MIVTPALIVALGLILAVRQPDAKVRDADSQLKIGKRKGAKVVWWNKRFHQHPGRQDFKPLSTGM